MSIHYRPTLAEIDLNSLRFNVGEIKKKQSKETAILAIVKANAYGHGAVLSTRVLGECGVRHFGVATIEEGIELRDAGVRSEIFVLDGLVTNSLDIFLDYRLKPWLNQLEDIFRFGSFLHQKGKEHAVHIKLDSGMGRLGVLPSQIEDLVLLLKKYPEILVQGFATHLAQADEDDSAPTERQFTLFERMRKIMEGKGISAPFSIANSAVIIDRKLEGHAWIRPGLMLYGSAPNSRHQKLIPLKPVMSLKSRVLGIKKFQPGAPLGYGGTFVTKRESLIASLPIGYADGYKRSLSNNAKVLICGKRAPVVGTISMDLTLVDITEIHEAKINDEVVLLGAQGDDEIRSEDLAHWGATISYEILCGISSRVPRIYLGL